MLLYVVSVRTEEQRISACLMFLFIFIFRAVFLFNINYFGKQCWFCSSMSVEIMLMTYGLKF